MNVILIRLRESGRISRSWLADGQTLTVGKSHRADLCLEDDAQLADVHFRIEVKSGACRILNMAGKHGAILLNGTPVSNAVVHDQDTIQAGKTKFRVSIDDPHETASPATADAAAETYKTAVLRVVAGPMGCGIQALRVVAAASHLALIAQHLGQGKTLSLLANLQRAGLPVPEGVAVDDDLLRHAPPEIRATDSLYLLPLNGLGEAAPMARDLGSNDAGILFVSDKPREEFAASHKQYWGWFVRPSILAFQLSNGSTDLAGKLFQDLYAAVVTSRADEDLTVYCHPEDAATIEGSLGMLHLPARGI